MFDPKLDSVVYYINSNEITIRGLYFGNHPSDPEKYDHKAATKISKILDRVYEWNIYYFDNRYIAEIIDR
ncbi:hypothetical protein AGMMS50229_16120 [Campylobacterota bacterium]|nr:hypothetical protein AGMMS50229_16120 [Campylobacterota bacterium]